MALAVGCTGALFNIDFISSNPLEEYHPYLEAQHASRKFFDRAAQRLGAAPTWASGRASRVTRPPP